MTPEGMFHTVTLSNQLATVYHTKHWQDPLVSHLDNCYDSYACVWQHSIMQFSIKHLMQWISGSMIGGKLPQWP